MATHTTAQWRHFPRYMMLAMGLVFAVNIRFIVLAVATFPGAASQDDFDSSNRYNQVLAAVATQNALGWHEQVGAEGAVPVVDLAGADHAPLAGASLFATAVRPLGTAPAVTLQFSQTRPGHFVAAAPLPAVGQWDVQLRIVQAPHEARVTRRVIVK